jgi:hypothetical protein
VINEKTFTVSDYVTALKRMNISAHHLGMLRAHYKSPNKTITATTLAKKMNFRKYSGVNLHYGRFAALLGKELGYKPLPNPKLYILVDFEYLNNEWHWIMWPNLAKALEKSAIV